MRINSESSLMVDFDLVASCRESKLNYADGWKFFKPIEGQNAAHLRHRSSLLEVS